MQTKAHVHKDIYVYMCLCMYIYIYTRIFLAILQWQKQELKTTNVNILNVTNKSVIDQDVAYYAAIKKELFMPVSIDGNSCP